MVSNIVAGLADELRGELLRRWPAYFPDRQNGGTPDVRLDTRECGYSVIFNACFRFPNAPSEEHVVVKVRREQKHGTVLRDALTERTVALTRTEYDEHRKAYEFFGGRRDGLSVVRPLDFIAPHNALVVEHALGTDMSELVKGRSPLAAGSIERCGRWWRLFHHDLHRADERPWGDGINGPTLEQRFARLHRFGASARLLGTIRREIGTTTRHVPPVRVPVSRVHGDCKLRHVWATAEGIQVLDFGNTKIGDSWIDPAALVVELSLYSLWRRIDRGGHVEDIRRLLHAYFDGAPPAAFSLHVVDCLLKKWHRRLRRWGAGAAWSRFQGSLKTLGFDHRLERLYIDRWFSSQIHSWLALAQGRPPVWLQLVMEPQVRS